MRVPPKLMAGARKSARAYGKCDSIDALAIARAALAHPDLPAAEDDLRARDLQLLVSHRESLVRQRSETQDRLRWLLHALEPRTPCPGGRSRSQARPRLSGAKAGRRQESPRSAPRAQAPPRTGGLPLAAARSRRAAAEHQGARRQGPGAGARLRLRSSCSCPPDRSPQGCKDRRAEDHDRLDRDPPARLPPRSKRRSNGRSRMKSLACWSVCSSVQSTERWPSSRSCWVT